MNKVVKIILTLVVMAAVMGYTIYNYSIGRTDFTMLVVSLVILGIPFFNMVNILIQELKDR